MCKALPARTTSFSASSVSSIGTAGSQRWIWYRSTKSVPRRFRLASISAKIAFFDRPCRSAPCASAVDLGRDHDLAAPRVLEQRAADDLLARAGGIHVGGVEEVDAEVERLLQERPARRLAEGPGVGAAVGLAVAHAAEAEARDVEAGAAELGVLHESFLVPAGTHVARASRPDRPLSETGTGAARSPEARPRRLRANIAIDASTPRLTDVPTFSCRRVARGARRARRVRRRPGARPGLAAARQDDPAHRSRAGRQRHRRHDRARARRRAAVAPKNDLRHRQQGRRQRQHRCQRGGDMPGDGYHFLFSWAGTLAVNRRSTRTCFDAQKDFVPILLVADVPNILVVNNDIPARTWPSSTLRQGPTPASSTSARPASAAPCTSPASSSCARPARR